MNDLSNPNAPRGYPPDAFGIDGIDPLKPLRYPARVDVALDHKRGPIKGLERLINSRSSRPAYAQQGIVGALLNEEMNAFEGLKEHDYRFRRLEACISAFDNVIGHSHVRQLSEKQTAQAIQLYRDQLAHCAGRETLSQLHHQVISHAAKALCMLSGLPETRPLVDKYAKKIAKSAYYLIKAGEQCVALNTSSEKLRSLESLCVLAKCLKNPKLDDSIIALEPQLRIIYKLLDSSDSTAQDSYDQIDSLDFDAEDDFDSETSDDFDVWSNLYSAAVDILIRHSFDEERDINLLKILRTMPPLTPCWSEALQALACTSKQDLEDFLPVLIGRSLDSEEAVAAAISLLAIPHDKHAKATSENLSVSFNPFKLLARHLVASGSNTMSEFLDHAKDVIKNSRYLFIGVEKPKQLLKQLKKTINELDQD